MVPAIRYLAWVRSFHPKAALDLARSGMPDFPAAKLSELASEPPALDDPQAPARFRRAIAERYELPLEEVVLTLGASGGLWATYAALLSPGDEILVETPTYEPMVAVAAGLSAKIRRYARPESRGFALDPDAVLRALGPETKVVALTNPHNPSALFADDDVIAELARELEARGIALVIDEVYRELVAPRTSARRLGANVIVQSSLTKPFGFGWARAGWLLAPREIARRAEEAQVHATGMLPPSQAALGALVLLHADRIAAEGARAQRGKRELVEAFARKHARVLGFSPPPEGSIFGFFRDLRGRDLQAAIEAGIASEGVIVGPGSFFEYPAGFRVGFVAPPSLLEEGLMRLERVLGLEMA